jgi:predicted transcriptional regulator
MTGQKQTTEIEKKIKSNAELVLQFIYQRLDGASCKWIAYKEISDGLDISRQIVSYTVKSLIKNGFLTLNNNGLSIAPEVITYIENF